jgi:hypothetical protein
MDEILTIDCGRVMITATEDHHFHLYMKPIDPEYEFDMPALPFCEIEKLKLAFDCLYETLIRIGARDVRDKDVEIPEVKCVINEEYK